MADRRDDRPKCYRLVLNAPDHGGRTSPLSGRCRSGPAPDQSSRTRSTWRSGRTVGRVPHSGGFCNRRRRVRGRRSRVRGCHPRAFGSVLPCISGLSL